MKTFTVTLLCVVFMLSASGCAVRSSQFDALKAIVSGPNVNFTESRWSLTYGGYRSEVLAIATTSGTLFSNNAGDRLLFDGWIIREASGLGSKRGDWRITDVEGGRQILRRGRKVNLPACETWQRTEQSGMIRFSQVCKGYAAHNNTILVNQAGEITLIRQSLDGSDTFATLAKISK